ncbi:MAG: 50S ribosomal protein L13 [Dehalococcoidia bacterium]|nr:50S ribosomal protein L13 [Dehalococcoidia bacterium]
MNTSSTKISEVKRQWHVIDASEKTLGRLATEAASILHGKHKPTFSPSLDTGDFVVVVNASRVKVTGKKKELKIYYRHSGYPGGLKSAKLGDLLDTRPTRVIEHAIKGMLPHNNLGRTMFKKLKVYAGPDHPHQAQVAVSAATATAPEEQAK